MSEQHDPEVPSLTVQPIGVIRTAMRIKFEAPHQPDEERQERNVIELFPGHGFEGAVRDLEGFDRIWLVWWFHRNTTWRPMVLPPRGSSRRRGVFATRSPHRPNPIGLTSVPLLGIDGLNLIIGSSDLLDGTPILDIKPYLPDVDAFPEAKSGWVSEVEEELAGAPRYAVVCSDLAREQLDWLRAVWSIDFFSRASELLALNPRRHRTRRISRAGEGRLRMACGAWRIFFALRDSTVHVERVTKGYPDRLLGDPKYTRIPDREAQIEFGARWPEAELDTAEG